MKIKENSMTEDKFKESERLYKLIKKLQYINERLEDINGRINIDTADIVISIAHKEVNITESFGSKVLLNFIQEKTNIALNEAKAKFEQL